MLGLAWLFDCVAKRNRECAKSVGSIATKSMTVKNGGNTIDAVEALALCFSHCISRACGLAGGLQKIREERTPRYSIFLKWQGRFIDFNAVVF